MDFFVSVMAWFGVGVVIISLVSTVVGYIKEKKKQKKEVKKEE